MKKYEITNTEMTLEEINAMIETIKNDDDMFSAEMADRLIGTEKEEYEHNKRVLLNLYDLRNKKQDPKDLIKKTINNYHRYIENVKRDIENGFRVVESKARLKAFENELAKLEEKLASLN